MPFAVMSSGAVEAQPLAEIAAGLSGVQSVVSYFMSEFGNLVTTIASQPLLLIPVGLFVCGGIIGLAKRLIRG